MFTTLRAKVFIGFLFILLLLGILGGYAIYSVGSLAETSAAGLEQNAEQSLANSSMYESLVRIDQAELRLLASDTESAGPTLLEEPSHFYFALQSAQRASESLSDSTSALLTQTELHWQDYRGHLNEFYELALHHRDRARAFYEGTLEPAMDTLKAINISLQEQNFDAFRKTKNATKQRARSSSLGILLVTLGSVLVGFLASYALTSRTIKPLRELTDSVKQLQGGHLDTRIPISGADEIADLGFEFNRLTERLQEFEAMNISEIVREKQKSEAIIESINDPLLLFDSNGSVILMNRAAEDITGITEQTALGRPLSQLFRDKRLLTDVERALEQAAAQRQSDAAEIELGLAAPRIVTIERRGRVRYFRLRVARIVTHDGIADAGSSLVGVLVLFTDITHFKELDRMKSDFIAQVSHEFRTPLTSMTMSLDILGDELVGALNTEQHDIIDTSKSDARRLSKLIRDLLTLARLESARQKSETVDEEFELAASVDQLVKSLRPLYQERRVTLTVREQVHGWVQMSREHFVSILSNLLSNALKHTPADGRVEVTSSIHGDELRLSVTDTGGGIAPEHQKRIFEKFVQVKHSDAATPGSVGLGLAIVREIASRYNGSVELKSSLGEGSTFTVRLRVKVLREAANAAGSTPANKSV
jgi:NtrC-family two-component system sensor histidine kinase KinB